MVLRGSPAEEDRSAADGAVLQSPADAGQVVQGGPRARGPEPPEIRDVPGTPQQVPESRAAAGLPRVQVPPADEYGREGCDDGAAFQERRRQEIRV